VDELGKSASLDPHRSRLLCLGLAWEEEEPEVHYALHPEDELAVLGVLWRVLKEHGYPIVGHHAQGFDGPYAATRALWWYYQTGRPLLAELVKMLDPKGRYSDRYYDTTIKYPSAWGHFKRTHKRSASAIAGFLGQPYDDAIDGSMVWRAYIAGRHTDIQDHCRADVARNRDLWKALEGKLERRGRL
jgi:predicted PolB exonuclease-like 3'-5' exonuclease